MLFLCFLFSCGICFPKILALAGRVTRNDSHVQTEVVLPTETPEVEQEQSATEPDAVVETPKVVYQVYKFRNNPFVHK